MVVSIQSRAIYFFQGGVVAKEDLEKGIDLCKYLLYAGSRLFIQFDRM